MGGIMRDQYAAAGSQRWLQIAVNRHPEMLDASLRQAGAIQSDETVDWKSPLIQEKFAEYRDRTALKLLDADPLPNRALTDFWPSRGPVWDALAVSSAGIRILVEAKAHIPEAASPGTRATPASLEKIRAALLEARRFYAPKAKADWTGSLYQYANRLALLYLIRQVNKLPSALVFLDFVNAADVGGPTSIQEWVGATRLIHALLGLPADLSKFGVYHAYLDASQLTRSGSR